MSCLYRSLQEAPEKTCLILYRRQAELLPWVDRQLVHTLSEFEKDVPTQNPPVTAWISYTIVFDLPNKRVHIFKHKPIFVLFSDGIFGLNMIKWL